MAVRIQWRRGEGAQWSGVNPILASGEVGFETDSKKFKVGDGTTRWQDLPYYAIGTITGVIAGYGLTGGGYSGDVTLALSDAVLTVNYLSAKGDLITALGDNQPTLLPVGTTDYEVLQVDAAEPTGLKYGQVQSSAIANNAVTTAKILDTSVTTDKIQDNAITSGKIVTNAITSTKIQANAVTGDKIADGSISETKIVDDAITTAKILDNAVTGAKFADNSVTSAKIANNTIVNEDINEFANIGLTKLGSGALPTTITVTTGNYINNSVTAGKLSNAAGPTGVGVWQDWTPTVYPSGGNPGFTNSQFISLYSKYMIINNYCTVWMIIQIVNRPTNTTTPTLRFGLPIKPSFTTCVPDNCHIDMGSIYRHDSNDSTLSDSLDLVLHVNSGDDTPSYLEVRDVRVNDSNTTAFSKLRTGDIISFNITYEVNSVYTPVPGMLPS